MPNEHWVISALGSDQPSALEAHLRTAQETYNTTFSSFITEILADDLDVDDYLKTVRRQIFDRESVLLQGDPSQKTMRVYLPKSTNIYVDKHTVFGRGIDIFRAALAIINLHAPGKKRFLLQEIRTFRNQIAQSTDVSNANTLLSQFHGELIKFLINHKAVPNRAAGKQAIALVRDVLWKDFVGNESAATLLTTTAHNSTLRISEPMPISKLEAKKNTSPWDQPTSRPWYQQLKRKVGNSSWFDDFMSQYHDTMETSSTTPMTRLLPNPANAYQATTISVNGDQSMELRETLLAITEPFKVKGKHHKQTMTDWNHLQLILSLMQQAVQNYTACWGTPDKPITIPLLYQTLITDGLWKLTADGRKSRSTLDNKQSANAAMREQLSDFQYYIKTSGELGHCKVDEQLPDNCQKVTFDLLETNNCINLWEKMSHVRNNDITHARQLLKLAIQHLETRLPQNSDATNTVLTFLRSSNYSWFTPYKSRGEKVKAAINTLSSEKNPLNLLLQAAVELKCVVHETFAGALSRRLSNLPYIGVLFKAVSVFFSWLKIPTLFKWIKHNSTRRKSIYKSAYEGIVTQLLGGLATGCMSAADRANEIASIREGMQRQYMTTGKIIGYNDAPNTKKQFFKEYVNTQSKHNQVHSATGTPGTKDGETRTGTLTASRLESKPERQAAKQAGKHRKGTPTFENKTEPNRSPNPTAAAEIPIDFSAFKHCTLFQQPPPAVVDSSEAVAPAAR